MSTNQTITRADLSQAVYEQVGLSRNESADLVETVLEEVCRALERGEMVKISSFGTFQVRSKRQRIGRNPKTGEEVPILPRQQCFERAHQQGSRINTHIIVEAVDQGTLNVLFSIVV